MKIVIVSSFFSEGMGYSENFLPRTLAKLGHEVHLVTSNLNIGGNLPIYDKTWSSFLGPRDQGVRTYSYTNFTVHRLQSRIVSNYVFLPDLYKTLKQISPDIIHVTEIGSLSAVYLAVMNPLLGCKIFSECHQHMSITKPYLKHPGNLLKKLSYKLTRTLPISLAGMVVQKCYAISEDCAFVANAFFGVPKRKIVVQSLGTNIDIFRPPGTSEELQLRSSMRKELGYGEDDIICIYTGRFSEDKNPLLLAKAISRLSGNTPSFKGLFIGEGAQSEAIKQYDNVRILPFMKHEDLATYYRLADIGVWPTQESMSMLDAAASGLPLVVSDKIGEYDRIEGNGCAFTEGDDVSLSKVLLSLSDKNTRMKYGEAGIKKMKEAFNWDNIAKSLERDYLASLKKQRSL